MRRVLWLALLCTAVLGEPFHLGVKLQRLHRTQQLTENDDSQQDTEESQKETSIEELPGLMSQWSAYKEEYEKVYADEDEEQRRLQIFAENLQKIATHNEMYKKGLSTYYLGVNELADLSEQEFLRTRTGYKATNEHDSHFVSVFRYNASSSPRLPAAIDWRDHGVVTRVKNQGRCGSCWAFAATGGLESRFALKHGRLSSLSEQNLVDCSAAYGNNGCTAGDAVSSYAYIRDNGGIDTEASYPYEGRQRRCRYRSWNRGAYDGGSVRVAAGERHLQAAVAQGPVVVTIDARPVMLYKGGVLYSPNCSTIYVNHAVLVAGYGTDADAGPFWLVKNSWGARWGIKGYFKLARNKRNQCGVASRAIYPMV